MVEQEGPTAEEKKSEIWRRQLAASRNRTAEETQFRERAAVGLMAAKRARMGEKRDDAAKGGGDRRLPYVWCGSGRVKQVLPGPPGVYSLYGTRVEAVGSAAVDQIADARRAVQEALEQEGAEGRAAAGRMRGEQQAEASVQQEGGGAAGEGVVNGRHREHREQAPGRVRQSSGLLPPDLNRTADIEQKFAEERAERVRIHFEWRRKVHEV